MGLFVAIDCHNIKPRAWILKKISKITTLHISILVIIIFFSGIFFGMYRLEREEKIKRQMYLRKYTIPPKNVVFNRGIIKKSRNPVIVWWTTAFRPISETLNCDNSLCDVFLLEDRYKPPKVDAYIFYASKMRFSDLPLPRRPNTVAWALLHEESPRNVYELSQGLLLQLFNYSSTFSRYSHVPFPLFFLNSISDITSKQYFVQTAVKNSYLVNMSSILYLQSNCDTMTDRDEYVRKLMQYINIDSYGICLNNKKMPQNLKTDHLNKLNSDDSLNFIARYKFMIAIENGICLDYVTEKFWRPIKVGTVPIYFGSPAIRDWMPNKKSAILIEQFPTPKLLSKYIKKLLDNDKLYEKHLEHKIKGIIRNKRIAHQLKIKPTDFDPLAFECYVCKELHKKPRINNIVNKSHYDCLQPISPLSTRKKYNSIATMSGPEQDIYMQIMFDEIMEYRNDFN